MDNKIQVEIIDNKNTNNQVYVSFAFRGGYITRDFLINNSEHFITNYAFFNVLFNYFQSFSNIQGFHFNVLRAFSFISFSTHTSNFLEKLNYLFELLFNNEYNEEIFLKAKEKTKEQFALRYKEGSFRAKLKACEVSDLHKAFRITGLTNNIETLDFETFIKCINSLIVPGNLSVYIVGEKEKLDLTKIDGLCPLDKFEDKTVRLAGFDYDPYLRQDSHTFNVAREDVNIVVESFEFLNSNVTNFTKQLILDFCSMLIPCVDFDVSVDSLDSSITCVCNDIVSYKKWFSDISEKDFDKAKSKILSKYFTLLKNDTEFFVLSASQLLSNGIYFDQYIGFIGDLDYQSFSEIFEKSDFIIAEAQVILRKVEK